MSKLPRTPVPKTHARLLVVDANTVCREGIRAIISRDDRYQLCGHKDNKEPVADLVSRHSPDLLIIDPFEERRDGVLFIKELAGRFRQTRILVVSQQPEEVYAQRILHAGARGYWMKNGPGEELIESIETVLSGDIYVSPRMAFVAVHQLVDSLPSNRTLPGGLTDRELHVFRLIGAGIGPGRIAGDLGLSRKTVETYQDRIKLKLGYHDAKELRDGARRWFDSLSS